MNFSRIYLNRLQDMPDAEDTVVVIDVLRSFTTAAMALASGASRVIPVDGLMAAQALAQRLPDCVSVGALPGGESAPGFDFGNSPAAMVGLDLQGKSLVMTTAAGVIGLQRFHRARHLFAASLVCARATAEAIRVDGAKSVCFVITGEWVDRDGDEDVACADYIEALLRGKSPSPGAFARRVRESDFGRRFADGKTEHLPQADLEISSCADTVDFAMPVRREDGNLIIRRRS